MTSLIVGANFPTLARCCYFLILVPTSLFSFIVAVTPCSQDQVRSLETLFLIKIVLDLPLSRISSKVRSSCEVSCPTLESLSTEKIFIYITEAHSYYVGAHSTPKGERNDNVRSLMNAQSTMSDGFYNLTYYDAANR
jgi:hypothetical protein